MGAAAVLPPLEYRAGAIRDYGFPVIAALLISLIPFEWIWIGLVVLGQAHFLTAYLYQYKGKKMNLRYLLSAALLLLAAIAYFSLGAGLLPILLAAATLFTAHFALDEFTLHGEALSLGRMPTVIGFVTLHLSFLIAALFPMLAGVTSITALVFLAAVAARLFLSPTPISPAERYLWFVGSILFLFAFVFELPGQFLGVILLLHFMNWYVGYGDRLKGKPERSRAYWTEVWVLLVAMFALYGTYALAGLSALSLLFEPMYFYAWAIAHIVLSFMTVTFRLERTV